MITRALGGVVGRCRAGRPFGLSRPRLRTCAEEIRNALDRWREFAERAGVEEAECEMLAARFNA